MTAALWTTEELPGLAYDPEPPPDGDEDDGPWCDTLAPGLLPEQRSRIVTIPTGEYL
ncbi:hypothetical protein [Streptomyces sp. NBC_01530]|uniref:hypothetical protein n=1 Tax=Streptomyces sp. NBC_01530 TaxID=2903895 RepID=UPI00386FDF3D